MRIFIPALACAMIAALPYPAGADEVEQSPMPAMECADGSDAAANPQSHADLPHCTAGPEYSTPKGDARAKGDAHA